MNDFDLKDNPYASPKMVENVDDGRLFRRGRVVFVPRGSDLPDWCVCCGAAAVAHERKVFRVMPIGVRVVLVLWCLLSFSGVLSWMLGEKVAGVAFGGLLLCTLGAMLLRPKAVLHLGWCERHFRRKRWAMVVGCVGLALVVGGILGVAWASMAWAVVLWLLGLLLALVGVMWQGFYRLFVSRLDGEYVRLRGAGRGFLARLDDVH